MPVLGGRLGDLFGRRRLFMAGVASFTTFSLLCGLAPTAFVLIAFRAAQGASATLWCRRCSQRSSPPRAGKEQRAAGSSFTAPPPASRRSSARWPAASSCNIGGADWRPIFLVNVPVGIVALALA